MPPKTTTWDKITPQFTVIHYKPDGTVHYIETQYLIGDSTDRTEGRVKMLLAADSALPMAVGLTNRLLQEARAEEGLI